MGSDSENEESKVDEMNDETKENEHRLTTDKFHVSQKVIKKFEELFAARRVPPSRQKGISQEGSAVITQVIAGKE